ncbi:MAG: signal peptidase [Lactobacillales bacterium]|jgi:cell fate regulator YaaT (PSP1 superfamily)|nr:signal peptidase [Lactobacillales bacterium]
MLEVVGVRFEEKGKITYYLANGFDLKLKDQIVASHNAAKTIGTVLVPNTKISKADLPADIDRVLRLANDADFKQVEQNEIAARELLDEAREIISQHDVVMKLIRIAYCLDRSKMTFFYTAENRVDFRVLVKSLATRFGVRIEMKQINFREEAKMLNSIGPCGRELCCATYLGEFVQVSIKMAKNQELSLNPNYISGVCGRLLCCLDYEDAQYVEAARRLPRVGSKVRTDQGVGTVRNLNILGQKITVRFDETGSYATFKPDEVTKFKKD